jgi:PAS domain S-box-containing protein
MSQSDGGPSHPQLDQHWLLQQIVEASPFTTLVCDAQHPDHPIIYADDKFEAYTGYTAAEVLGKNPRFLHGDDRDQPELEVIRHALRDHTACHVTLRNYRKDGTLFWNEVRLQPLVEDGELRYYLSIQRNVTREIDATEARHTYHTLVENSPHGMSIARANELLVINPAHTRILGFTLDDYQQMSPDERWGMVHPEDHEFVLQLITLNLSGEVESFPSFEARLLHKEGHYVWVEVSVVRIMYQSKPALLTTIVDITRRKRTTADLATSQASAEALLRAIPDLVFQLDPDGIFLDAHMPFTRMYAPRDEVIGAHVTTLLPAGVASKWMAALEHLSTSAEMQVFDYQLPMPEQGVQTFEARLVRSNGDRVTAIVRNVTERHQMQAELREREALFRSFVEQSDDSIMLVDTGGHIRVWNAALERLTGIPRAEALGKHLFDVPSWATFQGDGEMNSRRDAALRDMVPLALEGEVMPWMNQPLETSFRDVAGNVHWVQSVIFPIQTDQGNMLGSITRDVSDHKHMEAQLRRSEHRYRLLSDVTLEAIAIHRNGILVDANTSFVKLFGYNIEEMSGKNLLPMLFPPGELEHVQNRIAQQYEGAYEIMARNRDGHIFPVELEVRQLDEETRVASLRDITDRREAEAALRSSELLLRTAADNYPDGALMMLNRDLRVIMGRGPLVMEAGFDPEVLDGQHLQDFIFPETYALLLPYLMQTFEGEPQQFEYDYANGTQVIQVQTVPIMEGDTVSVVMVVGQDVTKEKHAQQAAFNIALEKERVKLLQYFIEAAAHEFRTPLSVIHINAHMLALLDDEQRRQNALEVIGDHISLLTELVNMLLRMVKLDSTVYTFEALDIGQLLKQMCNAQSTRDTEHHFVCDIDEDVMSVLGNADLLTDVITALFDNACRYSDPNTTITVRTSMHNGLVQIAVEDEGVGIRAEDHDRIFESFWRTDQARTTRGLGLGLAFARKVIGMHNGTISVESTPGVGSTFFVRLPTVG